MSTIEHISYRHSFNSGFSNVSKFAKGTSVRQIRGYVADALRNPVSDDGVNFIGNTGQVIGTDAAGHSVTGIRVIVRDGTIKSAFPVRVP